MNSSCNNSPTAFVQQQRLSDYCRTGKYRQIRGTKPGRVHHYRDLVFNVIDDALRTAYPLTEQLLSEREWKEMAGGFIRSHRCQSPQVWKLPSELYGFIGHHPHPLKEKYHQLIDLLYFEWEEIALFMMEDKAIPAYSHEGDLLRDGLVLNPEHKILKLEYPVHLENARSITVADKGEYFVLLSRDGHSGKINFMALSPYFAWLVTCLDNGHAVSELIEAGAGLFHTTIPELTAQTVYFLEALQKQAIIPGFKTAIT